MKTDPNPLSRPLDVRRLTSEGVSATVEASEGERAALAREFGLPDLFVLKGDFLVRSRHGRVHVVGRVLAEVEQICVVSLDPFRSFIDEPVDVFFAEALAHDPVMGEDGVAEYEIDPDEPDPIVDGRIDIGHLTAEFLALGLDPHPRKPGVSFDGSEADPVGSPFAKLAALRTEG